MSRCIRCGAAKGRRACPALSGLLCARCCATDRLVKIQCPRSCAYLEGELYQRDRRRERGVRHGGVYLRARGDAFMPDEAAFGIALAVEGAIYRLASFRGGVDASAAAAAVRHLRNVVGPVPAVAPPPNAVASGLAELARDPRGALETLMSFDAEGRVRVLDRLASEVEKELGDAGSYWDGIASFFREIADPRIGASPSRLIVGR